MWFQNNEEIDNFIVKYPLPKDNKYDDFKQIYEIYKNLNDGNALIKIAKEIFNNSPEDNYFDKYNYPSFLHLHILILEDLCMSFDNTENIAYMRIIAIKNKLMRIQFETIPPSYHASIFRKEQWVCCGSRLPFSEGCYAGNKF